MATENKSPVENVQEAVNLVKSYAIQETADPLKGIGTYLKFGIPGAILMALGLFFLSLAGLRGLQQVDQFNGETGGDWLIFVPYLSVFVGVMIVTYVFLVRPITKGL